MSRKIPFIIVSAFACFMYYMESNRTLKTAGNINTITVLKIEKDVKEEAPKETLKRLPFRKVHKLPRCIIIGAEKCGTTTLKQMLGDLHPHVLTVSGETNFFDDTKKYKKGVKRYMKNRLPLVTSQKDIIIENAPSYYYRPFSAARIKKHIPGVRLIFVVCDPVKRTMSDFLQMKIGHHIPQTETFKQHLTFKNGTYNPDADILRHSYYTFYLKSWLEVFPRSQILIINGQQFINQPYLVLTEAEKFLGLAKFIKKTQLKRVNKGKWNFYCWYVSGSEAGLKCNSPAAAGSGKGREHPQVDSEIVDWLKTLFIQRNEEFFYLSGVRYHWNMTSV